METKLTFNNDDKKKLMIEDDLDGIIITMEGRGDDLEDNFIASMRIDADEAELLVKVLRHYIDTIKRKELKNTPIKKVMDNTIEPIIIEGRPFTPDDLQHLDELNEEMLKQNPPKPYEWKKGILSHREWEELYFQRPITIPNPSDEKTDE